MYGPKATGCVSRVRCCSAEDHRPRAARSQATATERWQSSAHDAPSVNAGEAVLPRIAMVTAYDVTMARLVDEAGVDMVLVGDSLGMVVPGIDHDHPCHPRGDGVP